MWCMICTRSPYLEEKVCVYFTVAGYGYYLRKGILRAGGAAMSLAQNKFGMDLLLNIGVAAARTRFAYRNWGKVCLIARITVDYITQMPRLHAKTSK